MTSPELYTQKHLELYVYRYRVGLRSVKFKIVSKLLDGLNGLDVLDVGCGCGVFSNLCFRKGANVISIDFSKIMSDYTHRSNKSLFVIQADGQNLPVKDNSMDLVLALDVIEHVPNPMKLLSEIFRVLRRNGLLLLITDNQKAYLANRPLNCFKQVAFKLKKMKSPSKLPPCTHIKEYTVNELLSMLHAAKFKILKYDTFAEIPFFQIINLTASILFRGELKKKTSGADYLSFAKNMKKSSRYDL